MILLTSFCSFVLFCCVCVCVDGWMDTEPTLEAVYCALLTGHCICGCICVALSALDCDGGWRGWRMLLKIWDQ